MNLERWRRWNSCAGEPIVRMIGSDGQPSVASNAEETTYEDCFGGAEVSLVTVRYWGHLIYLDRGAAYGTMGYQQWWFLQNLDPSRIAWNFMARFENAYEFDAGYAPAVGSSISAAAAAPGPSLALGAVVAARVLLGALGWRR